MQLQNNSKPKIKKYFKLSKKKIQLKIQFNLFFSKKAKIILVKNN
jgi:hypothetical protein